MATHVFDDPDDAAGEGAAEIRASFDVVAFEGVYRECAPLVLRALRRLVPAAEVDDAAQDVFVVVARRLAQLAPDVRARTWVYGIVLKVAADHRRSARRRERRHLAAATEPPPEGPPPADDALAAQEARRLLHRVLESMEDDLRVAFVLVELEGLSVPEAAAVLELNRNTLASRLRVARVDFDRRARALLARRRRP